MTTRACRQPVDVAGNSCGCRAMISVSIANRLCRLSLDIAFDSDARVVALFGASGAGKSMTIGSIAGLVRPGSCAHRPGRPRPHR